jgi:LPXTG-site transpeptidase (sortase) family protein
MIPVINVDAAIEYVGLTPDGAMEVPSQLINAAWYNLGSPPGQQGSAVIAGHRSSRTWVPAVFDNLDELCIGDNLYIKDDQGTIISFIVREIRTYDPEDDASDVFNLSNGIHLNLITCSGDWNKVQKSYNKRLVIFADLVL